MVGLQLGEPLREKMDLALLFRKEAFDFGVLHLRENRRVPLWFLIFID